ncbi:2-aminoadipate transaminase [Aquisphaera giovannonii]|uniref:2-aminoadipate transaminase n=1 Tax=Aquisphaera giovannonii TaxID=406548 RepID=A0A5B9W141_9BACT|nr:PLP-dependent aminotransferase family protein [Aquisphaera giovannonii]QEH33705.1 2-aminoadipate transaminase [Aquisphaera giovannonii]
MQTELDTLSEVARVPGESTDRRSPIQPPRSTPPIHLSQAAIRTSAPSITNLMRMALENPGIVSLAAGFVDQQSLPLEVASRAVGTLMADPVEGRRALQYGTTIGHPGLRTRLIERLERAEGVSAGSYREAIERTVVTTGSAQLIYLVCEALLDPGDIVLVESPTYFVFLGPVETRGGRAVRVPIDEGGLRIDALDQAFAKLQAEGQLDRVKFVYTIPEHANPTGISLATDRRKPLVELVRRWSGVAGRRIFLLEDAAYQGLSYGRREPGSLWALDPEGETVILARTFSKTLSPGVKIGYGILPKGLLEPILRLKGNHDFGSANFNQQLLEHALASGDYDRHVEHLRDLYGRKRDLFLEALGEALSGYGDRVRWTRPRGGLFVWMTLPEGVDSGFEGAFFANCLKHGVLYVPGEYAFAPEPGPVPRNHLRLTFGVPSEAELVEGTRRLAAALESSLSP